MPRQWTEVCEGAYVWKGEEGMSVLLYIYVPPTQAHLMCVADQGLKRSLSPWLKISMAGCWRSHG